MIKYRLESCHRTIKNGFGADISGKGRRSLYGN